MNSALQLHGADRLAEAEQLYRKILAIDPNHIGSLHNLGLIAHRRRQYESALALIGKAIALNDHIPDCHNSIGIALCALGRLEDAVAHYKKALALDPQYAEAHNNLGNALKLQGKSDEAVAHFQRALVAKPDLAEAHNNLGNALREEGRLDDAVIRYQRALALNPNFADAHNNLGTAFEALSKLNEAVAQFQHAVALRPDHVESHLNLANALKGQGKLDEAVAQYRRALALNPDHAQACNGLGNALREQGKYEDAAAQYERALALRPELLETRLYLGNLHKARGRLDEAVAQYQGALAFKPDYAEAHNNLGNAFQDQGRLEEAVAHYRQALALKPDYAEANNNLGNAFTVQGKLDEAVTQYQHALALKPDYAEARSNLGNALRAQGQLDEAVAQYERALALKPDYAEAHSNLGTAFQALGKLDEAIEQFERALTLKPELAEAHSNIGAVLKDQGKLNEAIAQFERALAVKPDFVAAHSNLLFCLLYDERLSCDQLLAAHRQWDTRYGRGVPRPSGYANERSAGRRLKIGYVSGDFRQHSVAWFLEPLLTAHDHEAVEVFCYAEVKRPDPVTERFKALADHWRVTVGRSDEAVAAQIAADGIDILVDLAGHTAANRLLVFARKPAPVQVSWLGYPSSTGLSAIDYRLVDAVTDREDDLGSAASEELVRLDGAFLCYGPPADAPTPAPRLESSVITFGSFNNPTKYSAATMDAWAELLSRMPAARLVLKGLPFTDTSTQALYHARFRQRGVPPQRITLWGRTADRSTHLAHYREIDIALDPFPYNGTTTTCEALWMGVPTVTLSGDRHSGRVGASLLTSVGLTELIAHDVEEYIAIAVRLANDRARLVDLSRSLRRQMAASPLCDAHGFARKIEAVYRSMWWDWCQEGSNLPSVGIGRNEPV
jgi:predicted O-linked N-acetylglucosamine transferase (SPINDLY family)